MSVILEKKLAERLLGRQSFLTTEICACSARFYPASGARTRVSLEPGYVNTASAGSFPCQHGDAVSALVSQQVGVTGPFPGILSRVIRPNPSLEEFFVDHELPGFHDLTPHRFIFCSPAEMGLFSMFSYATIDVFIGEIPAFDDDLGLIEPACKMKPITYPGTFTPGDYDSYIRMTYNKEEMSLACEGYLYGDPVATGEPTWIMLSTYCRERFSPTETELVRYSMIVPILANSAFVFNGPLVLGQPASLDSFVIKF